jgi:N-acetylglucosaminyl-diphospho-decaprenol L-rhamnosyltransferase
VNNSDAIAVVVLNWRQAALTRRCLESLARQQTNFPWHLIVVDNESSQAERDQIGQAMETLWTNRQPTWQSAALLTSRANLGFAGGMNCGIAYARQSHPPVGYWLLNNDVELADGALQALQETAREHPGWGIVGSLIQGESSLNGQTLHGGYRYQPWLSRIRPCTCPDHKLDYMAGAALFIREAVIEDIGLLSQEYFLYGEELDLAYRAQEAGWSQGYARGCRLWHDAGRSTGAASAIAGKTPAWSREYFENRSALRLTWKYHRHCLPSVMTVRAAAKLLLGMAGKRHFSAFWQALKDFRRPLPKLQQSDTYLQRQWPASDSDYSKL